MLHTLIRRGERCGLRPSKPHYPPLPSFQCQFSFKLSNLRFRLVARYVMSDTIEKTKVVRQIFPSNQTVRNPKWFKILILIFFKKTFLSHQDNLLLTWSRDGDRLSTLSLASDDFLYISCIITCQLFKWAFNCVTHD